MERNMTNYTNTADTTTASQEDVSTEISVPKDYYVVLHNDDLTSFVFVIAVLRELFHYSDNLADDMASKIHTEGKGIVGMFSREIAEHKVAEVTAAALAHTYPLKATMEIS